MDHGVRTERTVMELIRYNIIEKVVDIPLYHPFYQGFRLGGYKTNFSSYVAEHAIIYKPSLDELGDCPLVRINSACFTGDIFGDSRCDCNEQLVAGMKLIDKEGGLIIYHFHHEGRGIGFTSKLATYKIMEEQNISTFEASEKLANKTDLRTYGSSVRILQDLGISKVRLITNNPEKKLALEKNGIEVKDIIGVTIERPEIREYLLSKAAWQGHSIDVGLDLA